MYVYHKQKVIENVVQEIEKLYEENQRLKNENYEIEKRIKYKKARLQNSWNLNDFFKFKLLF